MMLAARRERRADDQAAEQLYARLESAEQLYASALAHLRRERADLKTVEDVNLKTVDEAGLKEADLKSLKKADLKSLKKADLKTANELDLKEADLTTAEGQGAPSLNLLKEGVTQGARIGGGGADLEMKRGRDLFWARLRTQLRAGEGVCGRGEVTLWGGGAGSERETGGGRERRGAGAEIAAVEEVVRAVGMRDRSIDASSLREVCPAEGSIKARLWLC
jgi:hypothetical protein